MSVTLYILNVVILLSAGLIVGFSFGNSGKKQMYSRDELDHHIYQAEKKGYEEGVLRGGYATEDKPPPPFRDPKKPEWNRPAKFK